MNIRWLSRCDSPFNQTMAAPSSPKPRRYDRPVRHPEYPAWKTSLRCIQEIAALQLLPCLVIRYVIWLECGWLRSWELRVDQESAMCDIDLDFISLDQSESLRKNSLRICLGLPYSRRSFLAVLATSQGINQTRLLLRCTARVTSHRTRF